MDVSEHGPLFNYIDVSSNDHPLRHPDVHHIGPPLDLRGKGLHCHQRLSQRDAQRATKAVQSPGLKIG